MTKQDFIQYLTYPESLNEDSMANLEKLVKEYPYFQIGRMLYLKNLHNEDSIDYEKNLHITSAFAPNGKVLYNLIKKKAPKKQVTNPEPVAFQVAAEKAQAVQGKMVDSPQEVIPKLDAVVMLQETPILSDIHSAMKKETLEIDEFDELQILEKQMLREAYRTSMTIDLLQEQEERSKTTLTAYPQKPKDAVSKSDSHTFNDWLKVLAGQTTAPIQEAVIARKQAKLEIIDNFILEETAKATPKAKAVFYSAETMAKKSLQDDETFVSETLASIYLKQGNLPKALRSYEILLVKHPEKIHIFAPLLEKIKKLIKTQNSK